jgi:kynurenine/2-aminoadipate aminotransferase
MPLLNRPGTISLGGGSPNPQTFPIKNIQVELKDTNGIEPVIRIKSLAPALQYSETAGLPDLLEILQQLQEAEHKPPRLNTSKIGVTTGSQDGLTKAFEMVLSRGDTLLVEDYIYPGCLAFLKPAGISLHSLPADNEGLLPEALDEVLVNWSIKMQGPKPKVIYLIPTGSNPTGRTHSENRKCLV